MNKNNDDPILISRGCPADFSRPYWETVGEIEGAAGRLTCEFSAEESCSFPLAHLIRFEITETTDEHSLTLKFPMRSLIVHMGSAEQVNCLTTAIFDQTCCVLVALLEGCVEAHKDRMLHPAFSGNAGTPNPHVIYVRKMEIKSETFAPNHRRS
jgi:hypothetical protein